MALVVLVTGSRGPRRGSPGWTDRAGVWSTLDRLAPSGLIVGDADGVDYCARTWARYRGLGERLQTFDADWDTLGRGAGPIRNREMAKRLSGWRIAGCGVRVVAFHDDILSSKGTRDMLEVAGRFSFRRTLFFHAGTPSSHVQKGQL